MTAPTELDERALEAACAATVLGEDADGKPVHLEPQEAATAIRAYLSALPASEAGWREMESAPKDGTRVDLWGINHLRYDKAGERICNVAFGPARDWMGSERNDWQHGRGDDFEPTHWMPPPSAPDRSAS